MQRDNAFMRLSALPDFEAPSGRPDVRGWNVKTADEKDCGEVEDLVVDTGEMQVRYLEVRLYVKTLKSSEGQHVLIPLAEARLDDRNDDVLLREMTRARVAVLPPFVAGEPIATEPATAPRADDAKRFYGTRGETGSTERRPTLSEEEPISGDGTHKHARWGGPKP